MVLQAMANKLSSKFKAFCRTETMDSFLIACIEYFGAFFELQRLLTTGDEAAKDGKDKSKDYDAPPATAAAALEAENDARAKMRDIATVYAGILLKYSNYANTQQERQFFESLYDFSARVLFVINDRKKWQVRQAWTRPCSVHAHARRGEPPPISARALGR